MNKEQLLHIFDESACLTRRQIKDYVNGSMTNEESHAVEVHLNACPLCSDAVEGMFEQQEGHAVEMISELDSSFLQDYLGRSNPRVHLNSVAAAQPAYGNRHKRGNNITAFWRNTSIAAILLLAIGLLWFLKFGRDHADNSRPIAQQAAQTNTTQPEQETLPATPAKNESIVPVVASNEKDRVAEMPTTSAPVTATAPLHAGSDNTVATINRNETTTTITEKQKNTSAGDAVAVTQYKSTLIDKQEPVAKKLSAEAEKMPTRSASAVPPSTPETYASNSKGNISGAKNEDVSYTIEGVSTRSASDIANDNLAKGNALFEKGQYESALRVYKRELDNENKAYRQKAMVMVAQCHAKLGDAKKARQLLKAVEDEGGPEKKTARKLLKELEAGK